MIEGRFKTICPYASQIVVHGKQAQLRRPRWSPSTPTRSTSGPTSNGLGGKSYAEIVTSDAARAMVQGYVDELNAGLNRWETIKKFTILDRDLTVESGEMTPSLKLKRKYVETQYADLLDKMYD